MRKIATLCGIPFILGMILHIVGSITDNNIFSVIGSITIFAGVILVAVMIFVSVIKFSPRKTGARKRYQTYEECERNEKRGYCDLENISSKYHSQRSDSANLSDFDIDNETEQSYDEENILGEREIENANLEAINSSYNLESRILSGEYGLAHTRRANKYADKRELLIGKLLFFGLLTMFVLAVAFGFLNLLVPSLICVGCFGVTILVCIIGVKVRQRISMSPIGDSTKYQLNYGTVRCSTLSSMKQTGERTVRVGNVVYRVQVNVNGKLYNAYSRIFFQEGERIIVAVKKKGGKIAKIIFVDDDDMPTQKN